MDKAQILPLILSGGSGTRLWPLSRELYPKQFLPLTGEVSLLQQTLRRCHQAGLGAAMIIASHEHRFVVAEQARNIDLHLDSLFLEPLARNTAPAIAAAAVVAAATRPDRLMLVLPADHSIVDEAAWRAALDIAIPAAVDGAFVTFGIEATRAETGYGYIRKGDGLSECAGGFRVAEFVEKPDRTTAEDYLAGGQHLWNSGMFLFRANRLLEELGRFEPKLVEAVREAVERRTGDLDFQRLDADSFAKAPSISIDDALFARTAHAAVVPCSIGWSDVGSWKSLLEVLPVDDKGNFLHGDVVLEDTTGSYVRTDGILTTVLGMDNVIVVTTPDAVLVANKDRMDGLKGIVATLKKGNRREALARPRVYRPWGYYQTLHEGERFQVKRLTVKPGHKLSLQKHFHRAEHWVVVNGTATVTRDGETHIVRENESIYLPLGSTHRLENAGKIPLNLIEVQSGAYLGEDDIVRLEDSYGRV
ncbi:mannose-1-phosphate guanylyltransferase/mannose-6-phosphate isomerase [Nitrospirillum sp. BR 11164]|uniref:mannose-1-phosphate guanylyltransferase/mannose-6-phosphate isomerase n=1 Tax=Nitrospirillum sp. BR 11164 TaxID=3104324 RepID=UPI002AFE0083|nr:mannose-1-phosphate guanylyltransferase/mannose-6-phosphate isomerase [Nitrospirillum sp. BR 11164]MEA1652380.1 mannose-1-phosphate guanylyltransferase/mannose-6-phosphate isomerase [Nitrospirillum sp. BR 11164]